MSNSSSAGCAKKIVAVFYNFDVESWYIYSNLLSVILKPNRIFFLQPNLFRHHCRPIRLLLYPLLLDELHLYDVRVRDNRIQVLVPSFSATATLLTTKSNFVGTLMPVNPSISRTPSPSSRGPSPNSRTNSADYDLLIFPWYLNVSRSEATSLLNNSKLLFKVKTYLKHQLFYHLTYYLYPGS